jgi:hypothetical protein
LSVFRCQLPVVAHEALIVTEESLGPRVREIARLMAGRTLSPIPLLLVFVAGEALAHGRQRRSARFYDSAVARHALPANFRHA